MRKWKLEAITDENLLRRQLAARRRHRHCGGPRPSLPRPIRLGNRARPRDLLIVTLLRTDLPVRPGLMGRNSRHFSDLIIPQPNLMPQAFHEPTFNRLCVFLVILGGHIAHGLNAMVYRVKELVIANA